MHTFIEDKFRDVYERCMNLFPNSEYTYYLESVSNNGLAIFDVPTFYLTDEMVMCSIETPNKPLFMMTKNELERIKQNRILQELGKIYNSNTYHYISEQAVIEINKKYDIRNYRFEDIIYLRYKKFISNHYLDGLYTFIDFFNQIWMLYEGLDMICYAYLYRGIPIPIKIKNVQNNRRQKYKLIYDNKTKTLHRIKIVHQEYQTLRSELNEKLDSYYKYSDYKYLDEYSWDENPTEELDIPLFQDGEIYSTFETVSDGYGVTYDISRSYIINAAKGLEEYNVPESVCSIRPKAFMNCTKLKKIVVFTTDYYSIFYR